ncbi:PB1 domain-containing protein [Rhizoctonia solani AG-1 IA]|uniref:PB1 domain-containing protein n=1 Tax=Thanatephorus cucumeris (strain AG1-IA) TaxID=983506 RepID=L8WPG8_THACA|nr:PB1 domain-containing protein [Rhizoctonia solani AG-1 IA]
MAAMKLTFNGITRRVQFPDEHPAWTDVSVRVEQLFAIPASDVALSYVDPDGDTMYISSNDELFDMFHTVTAQQAAHRFTVHDMRNTQNKSPDDFEHVRGDDDSSSSSSSASSGGKTPQIPPNFGESKSTRSGGFGSSGMGGFGFAPFEMMFGQAATAASVKSPSQGHISPIPSSSDLGAAAAEAGQSRSQYGRSVASTAIGRSAASSVSGREDYEGNPAIHIQGPSTDNESVGTAEHMHEVAEPEPLHHPTPALYQDVATLLHSLSDAIVTHPAVSHNFNHILHNAHTGVYWAEDPHPPEMQQVAAHHLLGAFNSLLHTLLPPPPPRTPTQAPVTPAYTAAQYELPPSVAAPSTAAPSTVAPDETPVPSRLNTPSVAQVPLVASPAMTATSLRSASTVGPGIRPVLDMARADRASVRSDTDAGSVISGSGMGSPIHGTGPAWRFAGRSGGVQPQGQQWGARGGLNINTGAMVPAQSVNAPEAAKYVESKVKLEHMKEMYKQTKEEYRREREERKKERDAKKNRLIGPPEPPYPAIQHGDMFDKLNEALAHVPSRAGISESTSRKGIVPPPAPKSVADSVDTAVRTRQQLNNWLVEQLGDMGFSAATHPQVSRMVRDATRPYATNAENANENALLEELLAQLVPTGSK